MKDHCRNSGLKTGVVFRGRVGRGGGLEFIDRKNVNSDASEKVGRGGTLLS